MTLVLQPVRVGTGDDEGRLVLQDNRLVAILVLLSGEHYDEFAGRWFLEVGFGRLDGRPDHPTFADLDEAERWIECRLHSQNSRPTAPLR